MVTNSSRQEIPWWPRTPLCRQVILSLWHREKNRFGNLFLIIVNVGAAPAVPCGVIRMPDGPTKWRGDGVNTAFNPINRSRCRVRDAAGIYPAFARCRGTSPADEAKEPRKGHRISRFPASQPAVRGAVSMLNTSATLRIFRYRRGRRAAAGAGPADRPHPSVQDDAGRPQPRRRGAAAVRASGGDAAGPDDRGEPAQVEGAGPHAQWFGARHRRVARRAARRRRSRKP